jgi:predicted AAA+ superfamily ATPase
MNDAALRNLLNERSPWRSRAEWEDTDADIRASLAVPLAYEPAPLAGIRAPGLYVFRGPRRVGKSLELKRAVSSLIRSGVNPKVILYCACDGLTPQDLRRLVVQGHNATRMFPGPRYWFLDEVTSVSGWSRIIKELRDQDTTFRESCVVLTGSSAKDLEAARKDLADRRGGVSDSERLLLPMGFRDFCSALHGLEQLPDTTIHPRDLQTAAGGNALYELEPWGHTLADAWELYLEVGGFPRAIGEFVRDGAISAGFIQGLWDVLAGDAIRSTSMSQTEVMAFVERLVQALCAPVNVSSVAQDVGMSGHQAVQARIQDLVSAFLAWHCYRIQDGRPNTAAQRKLYFVDPLIARLPHLRNPAYTPPDISWLNEQQVGLALARAVSFTEPAAFLESDRLMYERTSTGAEIDFVGLELDVPFECKYTDAKWRREAQTMEARHGQGVMVTRSPYLVEADARIWAVPASMLAWLVHP